MSRCTRRDVRHNDGPCWSGARQRYSNKDGCSGSDFRYLYLWHGTRWCWTWQRNGDKHGSRLNHGDFDRSRRSRWRWPRQRDACDWSWDRLHGGHFYGSRRSRRCGPRKWHIRHKYRRRRSRYERSFEPFGRDCCRGEYWCWERRRSETRIYRGFRRYVRSCLRNRYVCYHLQRRSDFCDEDGWR